jgi:hypothetical protein
MLLIVILNVFNGQKISKFIIILKKIYTFDYNLSPHAKKKKNNYNMNIF